MKKYQLILIILVNLILVSCNKENSIENPVAYREVTFKVGSMEVSSEPFSRSAETATSLGAKISKIEWMVFSGDNKVSEGSQSYAEHSEDFGVVAIKIPTGNNVRVFFTGIGEKGQYETNGSGLTCDSGILSDLSIYNYSNEIFYSEAKIGESSTVTVVLARVTGGIELNILDKDMMPSNCTRIGIKFKTLNGILMIPSLELGKDEDGYTAYFDVSADTFPVIKLHSCTFAAQDIEIYAMDTNDEIIGEKKIVNFGVERNRKTIITGNLFSDDTSFTITVNDAWGDNIVVPLP